MTITQDLVRNIVNTKFADFDSRTLDYAKIRILDTVGSLLGGINSSGVDMMLDIVKTWGGRAESTLLGIGGKYPAASAVLVNGIAARSNDMEPAGGAEIDGKKSPGHYSATTVTTALAMAEKLGLGGKDLLTALIVGDDTACRIGAAGAAPWDIGWDPAGTCSRFGSAVIAGKLMGQNEKQMLNSIGIAFMQISGSMIACMDYTHSSKLLQGVAGWNGILSAELAQRGFSGPQDPLMGQFGYYQQFSREVKTEVITRDLGKKFYADEEFKLYPCCRGNASSVETTLKLVKENNIDVSKVKEIHVDLTPFWVGSFLIQPFKIGPCTQISAILNLRYNVASALLRKSSILENYTDKAINDPAIVELTNKIKINTDAAGKRMSCRIRVIMLDNKEFSAFVEVPRGDYNSNPITKDEIIAKFKASVAFSRAISADNVSKAIEMLDRLEKLDNLNELIGVLTPAKK